MSLSFIKKNISPKGFKSILDHSSRVSSFLSSKLSAKLARSRNLYFAFEKTFKLFRFLRLSNSFSRSRSSLVNLQFDHSLKNVSSTKFFSASPTNARLRSASRDFKVCRISLRKLASSGTLSGVSKSSW